MPVLSPIDDCMLQRFGASDGTLHQYVRPSRRWGLLTRGCDSKSGVTIPRIMHTDPSQGVSSHLSNGCHLALCVSPVNSFSDHIKSIKWLGRNLDPMRASVGKVLDGAYRPSIKLLAPSALHMQVRVIQQLIILSQVELVRSVQPLIGLKHSFQSLPTQV